MTTDAFLPRGMAKLIAKVPIEERHPGLQLDRLSVAGDQTEQRETLLHVCRTKGEQGLLDTLTERRRRTAKANQAALFTCKTTTPLTLHLARAAALENAGLCLHPVYGFVYLPGTGLKGMAHAYACEIWLPTRTENRAAAWAAICQVFGWAPSPWLRKLAGHLGVSVPQGSHSGGVIFHDAWPVKWPRLNVDIINNHHSQYYEKGEPPGDWEDPSMVSFLAVEPGTAFEFGLSLRRQEKSQATEGELLDLARSWLVGALCHLGAGAKTAAGYGYFTPVEGPQPKSLRDTWKGAATGENCSAFEVEVPVQLVSPAFLGGADRHAVAGLRLPSLKGLLRFWWRAWHGDLTVAELRKQEAVVFGSTDEGCGLTILPAPQPTPLKILKRGTGMGGGGSPLGYLGYGPIAYEKTAKENRTQFDALAPDQTLKFRLAHRDVRSLTEGLKTLWLLAALGGIGARSRRGWGALNLQAGLLLDKLPYLAACTDLNTYREALRRGLEELAPLSGRKAPHDLLWTALSTKTRFVLSPKTFQLADAAHEHLGQQFVAFRARDRRGSPNASPGPDYHSTKALLTDNHPLDHLPERSAFGMPYAQAYSSLKGKRASFTPIWQDEHGNPIKGRRASPLLCKIMRLASGQFLWQVAFLPARYLPKGAKVFAECPDVKDPKKVHKSSYDPPGPFGVETEPDDPQDTLLNDFLDWLEGKAPVGNKQSPSALATPPVPHQSPKPAPGPAIKPVNKGQTRSGLLRRKGNQWIAIFPGDDREALVVNPGKIGGDLPNECQAEFYIQEASKATGIRARFEKRL